MKQVSILILVFLIASCSSTKEVINKSPEKSTIENRANSTENKITIITNLNGYNAPEIEELITLPLEQLFHDNKNVEKIESISKESQSTITVLFDKSIKLEDVILVTKESIHLKIKTEEWPSYNGKKVIPIIVEDDTGVLTPQQVMPSSIDSSKIASKGDFKMVTKTNETENSQLLIKTDSVANTIEIEVLETELQQHQLWNELLQKHVSKQGNVNYKEFKKDYKTLLNYIKELETSVPKETDTKDHKLAYWINAYNALTIDLILRHYPVNSIKDIKNPWKQRYWKLGNKWYNLDEIEHIILRKMNEPRIHFAIVCASVSCPKLQNTAFTSNNLENQLQKATTDFLNDTNRNIIISEHLKLSKIFKWFAKDFQNSGSLRDFISQYIHTTILKNAKISYLNYNWNLNK